MLISLGHQEIAILNGPRGVSTSEDRFTGYRRALTEAGITTNIMREFYGAFTQESGHEMTFKALAAAQKPTAIFATNNFIAFGAQKGLQELGLRVPEDIALVGFDDLPPALVTFPFLTVAAQPAYEMGRKATEILLNKLDGGASDQFQDVVLPAEIVIRQSSGQVRKLIH